MSLIANNLLHSDRPGATKSAGRSWAEVYGERHRLVRLREFPLGIAAPKRVRVYSRQAQFLLQWWDPAAKKTLSERVPGDLIDAVARARKIDERLELHKSSGQGKRKLTHGELVGAYVADLHRRADAGELAVTTAERYATALEHYRAFASEPAIQKAFPFAASANRDFQLAFATYLGRLRVAPNGHQHADRRPLRSTQKVLETVRTMYAWAADPDHGNLLPAEFRNPFSQTGHGRRAPVADMFGEPDITVAMAGDLIGHCDAFQLRLFAPLVLFGLRASEPIYLFREESDGKWLKVACLPALGYLTKGRRDKRFPIPACLRAVWEIVGPAAQGLLLTRRDVGPGCRTAPLYGMSLEELAGEFQRRCQHARNLSAAVREAIRDVVVRDAGGLDYDRIEHEFRQLARGLGWPRQATLKDLRHLFSTCLENSGVPEYYRRYLMGQSPGRAPIVTYTHLDQLEAQYHKALDQDLAPLVEAIDKRMHALAKNER